MIHHDHASGWLNVLSRAWLECSLVLYLIAMLWNSQTTQLSGIIVKSNIVVSIGHALATAVWRVHEWGIQLLDSVRQWPWEMFMMGLPWLLVLELVLYAGCFICGVIAAAWMTLTQVAPIY